MGLKLWMVFEAVSPNEEDVEESLNEHVDKLESEKEVEILDKEFSSVDEVENPHPSIDEGFSSLVELQVECDTFTRAVKTVVNYGPTYVQVEGPEHYDLDLKDSQQSLQEVANTMQQYAQMGLGGVLVSNTED